MKCFRSAFSAVLAAGFLPWCFLHVSCGNAATVDQIEFFETRIRPVLAQDCYECHNSRGEAKGGLVLDHRKGLLKGGDQGPAVVPGKPDASLLIRAIRHDDGDLVMPEAAPKLDAVIIGDFEKWVRMGAPDPRDQPPTDAELASDTDWQAIMERRKSWWSFQPIGSPEPPEMDGVVHPVDRFVRSRLRAAGLQSSPRAQPFVLLRRLTYALTGMPPTERQLERVQRADTDEAVMEGLIDELLASPRFGERWARHWMDWIRYAESHGSEGDPRIENAHLYRDYLIRALNDDIPYDQLVREHVAGDLLQEPRWNRDLGINESLVGSAHWRMVFHGFAPTDALDEKVRFTDDQINVFSKAFLGLTVSCARCHDHKFDAISQADYYALFGILGSTRPGRRAVDLPGRLELNREELASLKPRIRDAVAEAWMGAAEDLEARLLRDRDLWKNARQPNSLMHLWHLMNREVTEPAAFPEAWRRRVREWQSHSAAVAAFRQAALPFRARFNEWYREGVGLDAQPSSIGEFAIEPAGENAVLGVYPSGVYSHLGSQKHPARLTSPDFRLEGKNELWMRVLGGGSAMARYVVQNYPRNGTVYPFKEFKKPSDAGWAWVKYNVDYWSGDSIHIELTTARDAPLLTRPSDRSWFGISDAVLVPEGGVVPVESRSFLEPVFELASVRPPKSLQALAAIYAEALKSCLRAWKRGDLSDGMALFLNGCLEEGLVPNNLRELGPVVAGLVQRHRELEEAIPVPTRVPTLAEWKARDQPLFERGDHKKPLEPVSRRFLEAIDATPYRTDLSGRLELAGDLLRGDNPFTRRVIVNRLWHHLFGRGLVPTTDNFGRMGEKPSHPELLDYLANRLLKEDWSLKRIIRLLVTSATWQQDSRPSEAAQKLDPENAMLSHFNVRRLDAEAIRDSLLAAAGTLDLTLHGPPVDGRSNRRSVYVRVIRNDLDPFLNTFDAPTPFAGTGRRDVTTVPAQSLALFNDRFVLELAGRVASDLGAGDAFIGALWRRLLGRDPRSEEERAAAALQDQLVAGYGRLRSERAEIGMRLARERAEVAGIIDSVRERLLKERGGEGDGTGFDLKPLAHWDFEGHLKDLVGGLHGVAKGSARVESGALVLDGRGWVATPGLSRALKEKTLQARVVLDDLRQMGGGVMTVQTRDGAVFDSIVIGERRAGHWLAGSDHHRRTKDFGGPREASAESVPVVVTIVYRSDGTITGYRNGQAYGAPLRTGVQEFPAEKAQVVFGLRHGTAASGNRPLRGRILDATLYDRALTDQEVLVSATGTRNPVSESMIQAGLTDAQRRRLARLEDSIRSLEFSLKNMGPEVRADQARVDLVHSVFNLKEFIYVR